MQVKTLFLSENTLSPLLKNINTFFLHRMLFNKSGKKTAPPGAFPTRRGTSAEDGVSLKNSRIRRKLRKPAWNEINAIQQGWFALPVSCSWTSCLICVAMMISFFNFRNRPHDPVVSLFIL